MTSNPPSKKIKTSEASSSAVVASSGKGKDPKEQDEKYDYKNYREHVLLRGERYLGSLAREMTNVYLPVCGNEDDDSSDQDEVQEDVEMTTTTTTTTSTTTTTTTSEEVPVVVKKKKKTVAEIKAERAKKLPRFVNMAVEMSPGSIKIFDEPFSNALDHCTRDLGSDPVTEIHVDVNKLTGVIKIRNNGKGIPVEKALIDGAMVYHATALFSRPMSGSNFDDDNTTRKTVGLHGEGSKLTNIFSKWFSVTINDGARKLKFYQRWENNMGIVCDPVVKASTSAKGSVTVEFLPDYERLGVPFTPADEKGSGGMEKTYFKLLYARVLGCCACVPASVKVYFNGERIDAKNLFQYAEMYLSEEEAVKSATLIAHEVFTDAKGDARYELCAMVRKPRHGDQNVSFVNNGFVAEGAHLKMAYDAITAHQKEKIEKGKKSDSSIADMLTPSFLKKYVFLVVKAVVDNPAFDGQSKEKLTTTQAKLGFKWSPSDTFMTKIDRLGIRERIEESLKEKQLKSLMKGSDAKANTNVRRVNVNKLEDADNAGLKNSNCTLILTEGDSAKTLAVAGRMILGSENFGVFPLRGKLINPQTHNITKVRENLEVIALEKILNLKWGHTYTNMDTLRYKRIWIFADQDVDGSHIAGLIYNLFLTLYPSLFDINPNFIEKISTDLIKLTPKSEAIKKRENVGDDGFVHFTSMPMLKRWMQDQNISDEELGKKFAVKYYKGLGTSTLKEAKEYFHRIEDIVMTLKHTGAETRSYMSKFFGKNNSDERKKLLMETFDPESFIDYTQDSAPMEEFLVKDMLNFSYSDNVRSIPRLDGFKYSQGISAWTMMRRNITTDVKVAQIGPKICEDNEYAHNEKSINDTVTFMAQNHIGSNNINLFVPSGQFGSRLDERKMHASDRYIFTRLDPITRFIFRKEDDPLLKRRFEEGKMVEPEMLLPIIPFVLVNGADGIGTGYSCTIPCYNPKDIVGATRQAVRRLFFPTEAENKKTDDIKKQQEQNQREQREQLEQQKKEEEEKKKMEVVPQNDKMEVVLKDDEDDDPFALPTVTSSSSSSSSTNDKKKTGSSSGTTVTQQKVTVFRTDLTPWYHGFIGSIVRSGETQFECRGVCRVINPTTVEITEIPPEEWADPFREKHLNPLVIGGVIASEARAAVAATTDAETATTTNKRKKREVDPFIKNIQTKHDTIRIHYILECDQEKLAEVMANHDLYEVLGLVKKISTSNMTLWREDQTIKKYTNAYDIIDDFVRFRQPYYEQRRENIINECRTDLVFISNRYRFVLAIISNELVVAKRKRADLQADLEAQKYDRKNDSYAYLLDMSISSLTEEQLEKLSKEKAETEARLNAMLAKTWNQLWEDDLVEFEAAYETFLKDRIAYYADLNEDKIKELKSKTSKKKKSSSTVSKASKTSKTTKK